MSSSSRIRRSCLGAALALMLVPSAPLFAQMPAPPPKSEIVLAVEAALTSPIRTPEERARDNPERKPAQTLEFMGLKPNMTVVELFPSGGWYTKILGTVLADKGKLLLSPSSPRLMTSLKEWKLEKVESLDMKMALKPTAQFGVFESETVEMPANSADMVLTFRNFHNMTPATRAKLNKAVFSGLKPGGVYGIVDHTRRHMEPTSPENWRRADPVEVIKEVLDAGFVFEAYSTLHYRPDDDLKFDTQRKSIAGYSDRFTFRFRKPAK